jgi:hypothetical protein
MNVLREKFVFVATKNSMFDLIMLKRELKAGAVMIGYSSNDPLRSDLLVDLFHLIHLTREP